MRKDIGLEVTDHIILTITAQGELLEAAKEGADMISSGAQADAVLFAQPCENAKQWGDKRRALHARSKSVSSAA